jgi:hypothetical protein
MGQKIKLILCILIFIIGNILSYYINDRFLHTPTNIILLLIIILNYLNIYKIKSNEKNN